MLALRSMCRPVRALPRHFPTARAVVSRTLAAAAAAATPNYDCILVETRGAVGLITLNRPKALNALNSQLIRELNAAAAAFDKNDTVGAIVITGSDRAFAAGADIKEMAKTEFPHVYTANMFAEWADLTKIQKPVRPAANFFITAFEDGYVVSWAASPLISVAPCPLSRPSLP